MRLEKLAQWLWSFQVAALLFVTAGVMSAPGGGGSEQTVNFLVVSDWGGYASENQLKVAHAMGVEAARTRASCVVTAGDNFHGTGIASADDPRWKTEYEEIYSDSSLNIPWHPTLGNHDYEGSPDAEIRYSARSARWRFPARYYVHTAGHGSMSVKIVHIDTSPFIKDYVLGDTTNRFASQDVGRQLVWLDSVLSSGTSPWTIVVGHHPIRSAAPMHGDTPELVERLLPILQKHHVPLFVSGHDHVLQHLRADGLEYCICGGGASPRDALERPDVVFGIKSLGFLSVHVSSEKLTVEFRDDRNAVLHAFDIRKGAGQ
jgi:tartrate-resistant acid phosphatase type 5